MYFLIVGVLLLGAKMAGVGPTAGWPWWVVLAPFGLAVAWWSFADASGWTKRRAMQRMDDRKQERREKAIASLGLGADGRQKGGARPVRLVDPGNGVNDPTPPKEPRSGR